MKDNGIYFYMKGIKSPKEKETRRYTFPSNTADMTLDLMNEFKMEPALRRFANNLLKQLKSSREDLIGLKITGIDFSCILKTKKEE